MFSWKFFEKFQNNFYSEQLWKSASVLSITIPLYLKNKQINKVWKSKRWGIMKVLIYAKDVANYGFMMSPNKVDNYDLRNFVCDH